MRTRVAKSSTARLRPAEIKAKVMNAVGYGAIDDVRRAFERLPAEKRARIATEALGDAVTSREPERVRLLLALGANPMSGLGAAVFAGPELLTLLLDAGACPLAALEEAARQDTDDALQLLLSRATASPKRARALANALFVAIVQQDASKVRLLVSAGADPTMKVDGTALVRLAEKYPVAHAILGEPKR